MYADEQINVLQSTFLFIIFVWNHPKKNCMQWSGSSTFVLHVKKSSLSHKKVKISQHVYAFTKGYQTSSLNIKFAH